MRRIRAVQEKQENDIVEESKDDAQEQRIPGSICALLTEIQGLDCIFSQYQESLEVENLEQQVRAKEDLAELAEQMNKIDAALVDEEKARDAKKTDLGTLQSQTDAANEQIRDIDQQLDNEQRNRERDEQLSALENDRAEIEQRLKERDQRMQQRQQRMRAEEENEQRLKRQLEEIEKVRAENRRRFEAGLLTDLESEGDRSRRSDPLFEARDRVVKVHAINLKSRQARTIFSGAQGVARKTFGTKAGLDGLSAASRPRYCRS